MKRRGFLFGAAAVAAAPLAKPAVAAQRMVEWDVASLAKYNPAALLYRAPACTMFSASLKLDAIAAEALKLGEFVTVTDDRLGWNARTCRVVGVFSEGEDAEMVAVDLEAEAGEPYAWGEIDEPEKLS